MTQKFGVWQILLIVVGWRLELSPMLWHTHDQSLRIVNMQAQRIPKVISHVLNSRISILWLREQSHKAGITMNWRHDMILWLLFQRTGAIIANIGQEIIIMIFFLYVYFSGYFSYSVFDYLCQTVTVTHRKCFDPHSGTINLKSTYSYSVALLNKRYLFEVMS